MRNERLKSLLQKIDLEKCTPIIDNHIYYVKTPVKQRCSCIGGGYRYITTTNEFLLIAENGVKQAIILRCDESDLHWYVLKPWRKKHVLSNALRTGVIKKLWPEKNEDEGIVRRILRWIWNSASMSIACQITTGPIAWIYFGTFPQYFLLTNLMVIPLVSIIIPSGLLTLCLECCGVCPAILIEGTEWLMTLMREGLEIIASF